MAYLVLRAMCDYSVGTRADICIYLLGSIPYRADRGENSRRDQELTFAELTFWTAYRGRWTVLDSALGDLYMYEMRRFK